MSKPDSLHVGLCLALLALGAPAKTSATEESALDWRVDARLRYEVVDPAGFGRGPQDDDGFALWRIAPSVRTRREDALYGAPAATQTRDTLGARIVRRPGEWLFEAEALVQSGDLGELEIRAWAVAGEVRATLTTLGSARLRAGFTASAASGDSNPGDRRLGGFDPLFPNPAYTGSFPLFGPTNIVAIDPGIALEWPDGKRLAVDVARMRRIEVRDPVYNLNGGPIPGLSDGRDIGALWALSGSIRLSPQWTFNATAAHLEAGDYFGPSGRDIGAAFVNLNFTF